MPPPTFTIKTHTFPGQHIRNFAGATRHKDEDRQYLEAKQYTPLSHIQEGIGITIIGAPAISFPKEMYEPLWDDLLTEWNNKKLHIASIWTVDPCNQGQSGVLNENTQGDEPTWVDFARDLLCMINHFREEFPLPIVGVGHSIGAVALLELSRLHPRLLASVILFDPVMGDIGTLGTTLIYMSSIRPDLWSSREEAEAYFRSLKSLQKWDERVMKNWLEYGLHSTPTRIHPEPGKITLQTTKANESWSYGRCWFDSLPSTTEIHTSAGALRLRAKYPDHQTSIINTHPFYRSEMNVVWRDLPHLTSGCLYVFPDKGPMSTSTAMDAQIDRTGVGSGGSGGKLGGRVSKVIVKGTTHLLPFEKPLECAKVVVDWLGRDLGVWAAMRGVERGQRDDKSVDRMALSKKWVDEAKAGFERSRASFKAKL